MTHTLTLCFLTQTQVTEHRLPREYDYHRMPAPWIQLKLLKLLGSLGAADKVCSDQMYEILHEVMKRADIGINVGYAIVYEAVRTCTTIVGSANALLTLICVL
jgi:AP-4 complex subunit epsilon-1